MRHALHLPPIGSFGDVHVLVDLAIAAEEAGWEGFFLWDHIQYEQPVALADAWISLSAIAAATSTIRIGPLVTPLPRRRPWKVAREAVTLDHLSRGRLVLGVGLGIDFWQEFSSFSGEAADDRERARLLDDGIDIITRLWSGTATTYEGDRLSVDGAQFVPPPVQRPRIPIWSALVWPPSRGGPLRRAARCEGVMPFQLGGFTPDTAAQARAAVADARGGDDGFDLCLWGTGPAEDFEAAGVTWLVQSFAPEEPVDSAARVIAAGPPR